MNKLSIPVGALIMLSRGEAHIIGRYVPVSKFGFTSGPMLVLNPDLCDGYNVDVLVENHGWTYTVLEAPPA